MRHYYLGLAANYSRRQRLKHTFAIGRKVDCDRLTRILTKRYQGEKVILTKNGRSALTLALMANFDKGDKIIVNAFTCYAVYEAIKAAGLEPVFADINKEDLNFGCLGADSESACPSDTLRAALAKSLCSAEHPDSESAPKGIIVQNTLGNPTDIEAIEKFAAEYNIKIIEDLAHCAGRKYKDGREMGTVGAATILSFGKDKSIDTVSGGALILRHPYKNPIEAPSKMPKISDHLRARFYPMFGALVRTLSYVHLGGPLMRGLIKIHFVEKSADNKLDIKRKISKFEAKLAAEQFKSLKDTPLREFCLVKNRNTVLKELKEAGYYFDGFWYERPVSPERYYKKTHFPEKDCPVAVEVSEKIINLPTYYSEKQLEKAREIIKKYSEAKNEVE
ncbi:DegT/DnrJ/EryC1/StrS aminotransferase family protein [Candidatus Saccharibacteria bacterium]|nr:DegT/DnrJ/EryC1/StrS aminotransferase family protein [Candidatus Saccharibacteria bacterium]